MKRFQKAVRSSFYGLTLKIIQVILPFIVRTVLIYTLGVEYIGLKGVFTSIIQVLNVAELGVGTALVFSMYEPIAYNDKYKICALLKLYKKYYSIIGLVVLLVGVIVIPFLPFIITGNIPSNINIYVLYIINLLITVFSYWIFSYRNSLFIAHHRQDIINKISIVTYFLEYIIEIFVLISTKNFYLYFIVALFTQIIINLITAYFSKKYYPEYEPLGTVDSSLKKELGQKVKDLFMAKIGQVITYSSDTIIISAFLGITTLGLYQNYYYIISSLISIMTIFFRAASAGIGNSLIVETKAKNYFDFQKITYLWMFAFSIIIPSLLCLYQPFIKLWIGEIYLLEDTYLLFFVLYLFCYEFSCLLCLYKDAAGEWHADRFRPLIVSIINLLGNIIMVNFLGLYGVLLSTIIAYLFIDIPWLLKRLFNSVFMDYSLLDFLKKIMKYLISIIFITIIIVFICLKVNINSEMIKIIVYIFVIIIIAPLIFILFTCKSKEFVNLKQMMKRLIKKWKG